MVKDTDIAWLAGIVDGEGCFSVKRPIDRADGKYKTAYQVWLVLCNTSEAMIQRSAAILTDAGIHYQPIRRVWKGARATRWQYWLHVARKIDLLRTTQILLPQLTAKRLEAEIVVWYLTRACQHKVYRTTALDRVLLDAMATIKRNSGEAPTEIRELLREVIPSQAVLGQSSIAIERAEGVETRSVSPNDNPTHERPVPKLRVME